jgi:hypothetical protein
VLVIGGGAGLFVTMRSGAARQKAEAERVARERAAAAAAESTASVARIDSMRAAAKLVADSLARLGKLPGTTASSGATAATPPAGRASKAPATSAAAAAAGGAAEPATPKVVEKGPFGLDVGTFLAEDRANSELTRLAGATGLKGKVVTLSEDGGDVYHVVLGSFPTRAAAERRAESLLGKALVNQAQTIPLAP